MKVEYVLLSTLPSHQVLKVGDLGAFTTGPVVKTSPSNAGDVGLNPHQEAKIPHSSWQKKRNQNIKKGTIL